MQCQNRGHTDDAYINHIEQPFYTQDNDPPVRTDAVWGRAQSGPVPPEGRTGPGYRLAVLGLDGLGPDQSKQVNIYQFQSRSEKTKEVETVIPATLTQIQPDGRSAAKASGRPTNEVSHFGYRLKGQAEIGDLS